ncbi:hypothetical protein GALL_470280 [mine drainage metagenome]|uniref:Uncharacterized protein n=1 Tax=mine drainage metagenome TaxID=410659 RepID=A0A1J5PUT1_9ZZZZ
MEREDLPLIRDHLRFVDHKARDGVGLVIGQVPVGGAVEVADRHRAFDHRVAGFRAFDRVFRIDVEFVGDLAHDLFKNIIKRDEAAQAAVFVNHQREMGVAAQELAHLVVERRGFRHEIGLHRDLHHVKIAQRGGFAVGAAHQAVNLTQQILGVDHAHHVLRLAAVGRDAGVRRGEALGDDLIGVGIGVGHLDLTAVAHHLFDRAVAKVERAQQAVAVFLHHRAFRVAERDGADDFFAKG